MKDDAERARERLGKLVAESGRYSSVASHAFATQGRDIFILASDAIELAVAFAQQPEGSITDDEAFVWRWVERALYDPTVPMTDALNVLAHYPGAPWNRMRWNVDHKSYADQFYRNHPAAMLDVAPIPGEE